MLSYESWAGWQKQYHSSSSQTGPNCFGRGFTLWLAMVCICLSHIIQSWPRIKGKMLFVLLLLHSVPSHAKKVKTEVPLFSFFFSFPFFLSEQGNLCTGRIQRGTREGKTSFSQKWGKQKRMLLAFPVCEGVKPFCCELFILKGKCHQHPCCHATKPHFRPLPPRHEILALL